MIGNSVKKITRNTATSESSRISSRITTCRKSRTISRKGRRKSDGNWGSIVFRFAPYIAFF